MLSNSNSNNNFQGLCPTFPDTFQLGLQLLFVICETSLHLSVLVGASPQLEAVKASTQICGRVRECKASKL